VDLLAALFWPFVIAFVYAAMHEHLGRDPRVGGLAGFILGMFFGWAGLIFAVIWYSFMRKLGPRASPRRRWYEWWRG
jgi:hypothetical protein